MKTLRRYTQPKGFETLFAPAAPWLLGGALALLALGLGWGLLATPPERVQGASVKILFIHAPSAIMAINAWLIMVAQSLGWLLWRNHLSAMAAKSAAPVGLLMCLIATVTGALWGHPVWGAAWVPDARLVSFALLAGFFVAYIALWSAIPRFDSAADLTALLCIIGSVFALFSRYAVDIWSGGQHQPSSFSLDRADHVDWAFYAPFLLSLAGMALLFIALTVIGTLREIYQRKIMVMTAGQG